MAEKQAPELLSAEAINALAKNAESIRGVISSNDEKMILRKGDNSKGDNSDECCCPKLVKFKFVLCNVWIDVDNAACPADKGFPCVQ